MLEWVEVCRDCVATSPRVILLLLVDSRTGEIRLEPGNPRTTAANVKWISHDFISLVTSEVMTSSSPDPTAASKATSKATTI